MRVNRSIISEKGLVTLPKVWRDRHCLGEGSKVEVIYKMGGPLIITPNNFTPDALQEACFSFLEKGLSAEQLKELHGILVEMAQGIKKAQDALAG
jgi:AbrB family looped-hinge helix DNA binding protein